uniref:Uncharacterized protein n=1 Tax=viral metagenome TaxID=1070528 RepID=A0A6H1ZI89_9ZZZZ
MPVTKIKSSWKESSYEGDLSFLDESGNIIMIIESSTRGVIIPTGASLTVVDGISAGNTLDQAYDQGGAGAGKAVTVDSGAIALTNNAANDNGVLTITKNPSGAQAGDGIVITMGAQTTGDGISFANTGSGNDVTGTAGWNVTKAGVGTFDSLAVGQVTLAEDTLPAGTACYIGRDNTGDVTVNALTGKEVHVAINGVDVVDIGAGGLEVISGGLTVTAGGATITGNSTITGDLEVTGDLSVTGAMTWGATLTVDELILDSDGAAPAGTFAYLVSDNTGDLTANALTGKSIHLAINGNDEYNFSSTVFQLASGNNIQFLGDNGILDSAGNEVILVTAVGSAVNYLNVRNAVTGNPIILECLGTADKGFQFHNDQSEEILSLTPVASALYNINILSAASGGKPTVQTEGAVDIGIDFETSESEELLTLTPVATAIYEFNILNAATGNVPTLQTAGAVDIGMSFETSESEEMLELGAVATALYNIKITNAAVGGKPVIATSGAVDIGIDFETSEGEELLTLTPVASSLYEFNIINAAAGGVPTIQTAGAVDIGMSFETSEGEEMLVLENIATAVDYVNIKSGDGTTMPTISVAGDTAAIDLNLTAKGTGAIVLNNGTDPVILKFMGAQAGYTNEIQDVNGNEIIALKGVATAVCEVGISNAVAGSPAIISAQGEANSNLMLDTSGTGMITLALGGDEVLRFHDAAAMTFAAAADTAGHAIYMQTEDGGADGGAGTGRAGALMHISTGEGSDSATATAVGGAGGALSLITGDGGTGNTTGNGGVGGAIAITAGTGGDSGAGVGVGGTGGSITLTAGSGGGAGGGTAGAPGAIVIGAGVVKFKRQTIDMANSAVTLTLVPGTPTGTLLTGNILAVDANSGATEDLLLPPEADCDGLMLIINNTGGESIMIQDDAGGALLTLETANTAYLACDGTTWRGTVGVA